MRVSKESIGKFLIENRFTTQDLLIDFLLNTHRGEYLSK